MKLEKIKTFTGSELKEKMISFKDPDFSLVSFDPEIPNMMHEKDKKKRWADQNLEYQYLKPPVLVDGIVEMKLPLIFWSNSFWMVLKQYKYLNDKRKECELPESIYSDMPITFRNHLDCKSSLEIVNNRLKISGLSVRLNDRTFCSNNFPSKVSSIMGEHMCAYLWKNKLNKLLIGEGFSNYDMEIYDKKVDIKTKIRIKDECHYYYQATIPVYQLEFDCDFYIFVNIMPHLRKCKIIGAISKQYFIEKGELIPEGTSFWNKKNSPYKTPIRSFQYNEIPNWNTQDDVLNFFPTRFPNVSKPETKAVNF